MLKRTITPTPPPSASPAGDWLDLETLAEVEITSEDGVHPIESALLPGRGSGWRAGHPGEQTIRIVFAKPQRLRRICLQFSERQVERTQMYVLHWSPESGGAGHEVVRQQWNFSPTGASVETEEHHVDLAAVARLELTITPDISDNAGATAIASLNYLRLA
ncbi:MAG: hypothetical protein ABI478_11500 [Propionivibrio sp.]